MNCHKVTKILILLSLALLLGACNKLSVNWPVYSGYVAEVKPNLEQQNLLAMERLASKGFEVKQIDRGVIVYLPPSVYFSENKSDISIDTRRKISLIADELNEKYLQQREVEVLGHSSTIGSDSLNMALSKKRAESAAAELVFSKVVKDRINAFWFGESRPRYVEKDEQGNFYKNLAAKNQRVEFVILNPKIND